MRYLILLALSSSALALAGCGGGGNDAATTTEPTTTTAQAMTTTTSTGSTTTEAAAKTITIDVKGGKPVGGITHASVAKGETVTLVVHSDVADEVHVHGYDLHKDVEAGDTVRIRFVADIAGVFEAELESRSLQILELTVK